MEEGRYIYCIVNSGVETSLGKIGIEDSEVYTMPHRDIAAVVHSCEAKPYDTKDEDKAKEWIMTHLYVIDEATKRFGTVAPFGFDTIIKGDGERVKACLEEEYARLKGVLDRVKDRSEYGIQIFWDESLMARRIEETDEELGELKGDIKAKPKGAAYMLERKSEKMLKEALLVEAEKYRKKFYEEVSRYVDDVKLDETSKPEEWQDKKMLMRLSCLARSDEVEKLGEVLEKINKMDGFAVRFTGPWAPFSFVGEGK